MEQEEFDKLLLLIKSNTGKFYQECYNSLIADEVLVHDLGNFERTSVLNIMKDKANLEELEIQKSKSEGLNELISSLKIVNSNLIYQIFISAQRCSFHLILDETKNRVIGILRNLDLDFDKDVTYQKYLKERGYPNKDLFIFKKGLFYSKLF